jgi:NADPH-dependent 2,4-dienoyl-CoA reductase/sulfur reductase-like enzyme
MNKSKYMILGGGMVAGYAAKELAQGGMKPGELTIVSADNALPYERPPLSKGFLAGKESEENIRINPQEFYDKHGIQVVLSTQVTGIDIGQKTLRARGGPGSGTEAVFEFDKLVVATGARVRTLDIPGAGLTGIHYLRSLNDSRSIQLDAKRAKRAVVLGGGFIGMEVASVLAQQAIETTMILREGRVWEKFFTPAMSRFFESYYESRGVKFMKDAGVKDARGEGAINSVTLNGDQKLPCDLMVAGIGVRPEVDILTSSGIEVSDGVVVNEFLETSVPGIYAAGDAANYKDVLFDKRRRVEHWDNAVSQGQHCARALLGEHTPFVHVPYFFSDIFDLSYEFWGDTSDADEIVERGDLSNPSFSVWWLKQNRVMAAFTLNRPDEEREAAPRWIAAKQQVSSKALRDSASITAAA